MNRNVAKTDPCQNSRLVDLFNLANRQQASDIHVSSGQRPWYRANGSFAVDQATTAFTAWDMQQIVASLVPESGRSRLDERGSFDGAVSDHPGADQPGQRYRFNLYQCGGDLSLALRRLDNQFRSLQELGLPADLNRVCQYKDGLVLIAGPTGSGKSTTLATLLNQINETQSSHIITIEDPIEFVHKNKQSRISQRQVGVDTDSFANALVDALRQDPDVILVGELRDLDTIRTAVTAAETGHLVFATVHAGDCTGAIERTISVFPGDQQDSIRNLLAGNLRTVVAQHLLLANSESGPESGPKPRSEKGRVLASEILHVNRAASNQIGADQLNQLKSVIETHRSDGMHTLDFSLAQLWRKRKISERTARSIARNPDMLRELARVI